MSNENKTAVRIAMATIASNELNSRMRIRDLLFVSFTTISILFYSAVFGIDDVKFANFAPLGAILSIAFLSATLYHHNVINRIWVYLSVDIDKLIKEVDPKLSTIDRFLYDRKFDEKETNNKFIFYIFAFLAPIMTMLVVRIYGYFSHIEFLGYCKFNFQSLFFLIVEISAFSGSAYLIIKSREIISKSQKSISDYVGISGNQHDTP